MILLDTFALIGLMGGRTFKPAAREAIVAAIPGNTIMVSATSAWEIGLLATRTGRSRDIFLPDARVWFEDAVKLPGLRVLPLDHQTALEAAYLPGDFHRDPSDRWIVAAARVNGIPVLTSDRRILTYAMQGYVKAIAC